MKFRRTISAPTPATRPGAHSHRNIKRRLISPPIPLSESALDKGAGRRRTLGQQRSR